MCIRDSHKGAWTGDEVAPWNPRAQETVVEAGHLILAK